MIAILTALAMAQAPTGPWTKYQQAGPHELVVRFYESTGASYTRRYPSRAACERARAVVIAASQERQQRNPMTNLPEPFTACVPL